VLEKLVYPHQPDGSRLGFEKGGKPMGGAQTPLRKRPEKKKENRVQKKKKKKGLSSLGGLGS